MRIRIFFYGFIFFVFNSFPAFGQTACPNGVAPGSPQCGPDSGTSRGEIASPPPRPTGEWIKTWGAIAGSDSTGESGAVVGKLSQEDAKNSALYQCSLGGASDCEVDFVYKNQCAALVSSDTRGFSQASATKERAVDLATSRCEKSGGKDCKLMYSGCSDPIFKKY
ncbi:MULTISPECIES: DUF4189 domain-containing protein [Xanthomonas]|uniref:DUF4189 domain-containing protein n=1 Tax=Xanthomonas TaxID=338 RepID=UPI00096FD70F|nr:MULTISPECIES: DUF4189 domain-containing protein [Xanthomonas]MCC5045472.1 DUF4189 domain-containing protein [Xanthomonas campestris]MCC5095262.1 DUF4189 domain-containing protein [Xanthomonas campestris pv. incanae]MCE4351767.1 DUF4189 domain-containing protein [Xanthomonas hortorum pv. cynarae]MEA9613007.1 DUF4189 domain-containing protein [Xanthomonas campestris pv. incanae]PPU31788.1 DUF4189 domain-containing protein [Xanthomonas hortorum pv. cynarae]